MDRAWTREIARIAVRSLENRSEIARIAVLDRVIAEIACGSRA